MFFYAVGDKVLMLKILVHLQSAAQGPQEKSEEAEDCPILSQMPTASYTNKGTPEDLSFPTMES